MIRSFPFVCFLLLFSGCPETSDLEIEFGAPGSLGEESGAGSFRLGASTAATQIEDGNEGTDWFSWTLASEEGGAGEGHFIDDAVRGKTLSIVFIFRKFWK